MDFVVGAATEAGIVRENNQDSYCVRIYRTPLGAIVLAVVCDGMGGLERGEVASASMVRAMCHWADVALPALCREGLPIEAVKTQWTQLTIRFNDKLRAYGNYNKTQLGTTMTAMLIMIDTYLILQVGDSRAYEICCESKLLTKDQSLVQRELDEGRITKKEAEKDPRRNVLLQCIGAARQLQPVFVTGALKRKAAYLLCSDGFWHKPRPEELVRMFRPEVLTNEQDITVRIRQIMEQNMARQEQDNMTAIVICTQ